MKAGPLMKTQHLTMKIESSFENVFLVGLAVNRIAGYLAENAVVGGKMEMAVVEAVNNAIEHAYRGEPGHEVEILIGVQDDSLTFAVSDRGGAMEDAYASRVNRIPMDLDEIEEGGRGLLLIRKIMDSVEYCSEEGRNSLLMKKALKRQP